MLGLPPKGLIHPSERARQYIRLSNARTNSYKLATSGVDTGYPIVRYKSNGTYYAKKAARASAAAAERARPALNALEAARTFTVSKEVQAAREAQRKILNAARGFKTS